MLRSIDEARSLLKIIIPEQMWGGREEGLSTEEEREEGYHELKWLLKEKTHVIEEGLSTEEEKGLEYEKDWKQKQ